MCAASSVGSCAAWFAAFQQLAEFFEVGDALAHGENRPDPGEARGRVLAKAQGHQALPDAQCGV